MWHRSIVGSMTAPLVHRPGEGEGWDFGPVSFTIKADSEATQGSYSLIEAGGNVSATPHVHHTREEAFYVLEGSVTFLAGEDIVEASAGSFVLVPRGTMHAFRSNGESRLVIIHSPGGFERFFRELAGAIANGTLTKEFRDQLAGSLELTYHDDIVF
jgi:mannose-6-phosphate isomerase-like protein (cupin superfamily)